MDTKGIENFVYGSVGTLKAATNVNMESVYQKETVEHIVDQIIKLHNANEREYDQTLVQTMEILNQSLKMTLTTKLVIE